MQNKFDNLVKFVCHLNLIKIYIIYCTHYAFEVIYCIKF